MAAFLIVHLKDPTKFFDEVYRVLKDGGIFLVTIDGRYYYDDNYYGPVYGQTYVHSYQRPMRARRQYVNQPVKTKKVRKTVVYVN